MNLAGRVQPNGGVKIDLVPRRGFYAYGLPKSTPWKYRLRTFWLELLLHLRLAVKGFWRGLVRAEGIVAVGRLYLSVIRANGDIEHLGLVCTKVVTTTGVGFLVDAWQNLVELEIMKYHGFGTGTNAEAAADSALQTECTTETTPDNTRATGTLTEGASGNIFRSVGTATFDAVGPTAITEHGLLSQAAVGGGVLWDRSKFAAVNVMASDAIQATYEATFPSGG
jgi:hypothetical protein